MHLTNEKPWIETPLEKPKTVVTEERNLENNIKQSNHFGRFSTTRFRCREQTDLNSSDWFATNSKLWTENLS